MALLDYMSTNIILFTIFFLADYGEQFQEPKASNQSTLIIKGVAIYCGFFGDEYKYLTRKLNRAFRIDYETLSNIMGCDYCKI